MSSAENLVWFWWSLAFLVPWIIIFALFEKHRHAMLWTSILTMPFGLTEPLFVPEYWMPDSLFDLAARTGFDIESPIFCFGIGGVGAVLFNVISGTTLEPVTETYRRSPLHRHHYLALASPFIAFPLLYLLPLNPIYPGIAAMATGGFATLACRPDLKGTTWMGAVIFAGYYWVFIKGLERFVPGYIERVWNLDALSGLFVDGVPIEELLFAAGFGFYWAGVYAHFTWRTPRVSVRDT